MEDDTKDKSRQQDTEVAKVAEPATDDTLSGNERPQGSTSSSQPQMTVVALTKSDKSVSTYGMPDLQDYQRAVTYEIVFNSLLEKKMQAMKRDCEERKRNKRLKRKSIGRIFLAKRLFSSLDSRKSSMLSETVAQEEVEPVGLDMQVHTAPSTPQKLKKIPSKTAIRQQLQHRPLQDIELAGSGSLHSASQNSSQRSPHPRSKSKSNTASSETANQPQTTTQADDSVTSTLSNSSGKMVKRSVLVLAQTHGTPTEQPLSSSSGDSKQAKVPQQSREQTCDTASLASGYDNGTGARLNSTNVGDDSLSSLRDSIESLSFASSRCTVSFGATEIIPEDNDTAVYERLRAAKRQRILDAKSISAQCSPILPARHVIKTMVHAPMSPPVTKVLASATTTSSTAQPPVNIIEPLTTTATTVAQALTEPTARTRFLPNQFSYTDSVFESRNISRQNTSEDSANLTVSTLLNQSDSLSLHASPSPAGGFRAADFALSGKPVSINDRFKSKSTGLLVAMGNGRTRPPPPPPCETAQPSPVALHSPPELPALALPIEQLEQLNIASNIKQKILVDSFKSLSSKTKASSTAASPPRPSQSLHIVTMATMSELPPQYPVIDSSSSSTLVGVPASNLRNASVLNSSGTMATATTTMLNGAIVTSSSGPDDTAKLHRMTSTSTGSSIGPTGCCTTTKSSSRLKEKQRFKPTIPSGQSGSDDDYRKKKRKYKRYHRCSDPVLVYPSPGGLQHCILSMPPNDPIQYPYTEDYAYDMQLQMESDKNDDLENIVPSDSTKRKHHKHRHHRHKKRHRHKKPKILVQDLETQEVKVIDPDDLPQRARWTIIATACLLLLMCLMLVGITLRMAPIIDDMDFEKKCQIEALSPMDSSRSDLEETFISAKAKILGFLNKSRCSMAMDSSFMNASTSSVPNPSRLPTLKLPRFDGKYADYKRFITTFNNMVNDNPSITPVDKFNYLLNCLSGPALAVVEPFQVSDENYPKALKRLEDRYDNKVLIFLEHINSLFSVPNMSKGDSVSLRNIIDTISALRGSLLSLGSEMEVMNAILVHLVLTKVDADTKLNYDEKQDYKDLPSWDACYDVLSRRCQFLESTRKNAVVPEKSKVITSKPNFNRSARTFVNSNVNCSYCKSSEHSLASCSSFSSLIVSERFNFVKRNGHCINCLRKGHMVSKCPSKSRCRVCDSSHHTILHIFSTPSQNDQSTSKSSVVHTSQTSVNQNNPVSLVARSFKRAIIPTAVVLIKDYCGVFQPVRALLDSCSELNFITEETAKRLKLPFRPYSQEVSGIGEVRTKIKYSVNATIKSRISSFQWSSSFAVTRSISAHQPGEYINTTNWKIPQTIELADPLFYKPQQIDILLSTEVFFDLLLDGRVSLGNCMPCLTNTVFGWIVGGSSNIPTTSALTCNLAVSQHELNVEKTLKMFWEVEEYFKNPKKYSDEEENCENHFVENVRIDSKNRIQVQLPFKKSPEYLGDSFEMARKRFLSLERRLERDSNLKSMYRDFMEEYLSLGHMSPYTLPLNTSNYVIPHHCVLKPQSTTTKLRVVFDASAQTSSNLSLNDLLMVGPTIQQDLITTLFSFRLNKYALTADISKMYRQFRIDQKDRKYQLILWRNSKDEDLKVYQLNTVTYGLSAAPFLAIRCLFFIADKYNSAFPSGSEVLRNDLYVDDVLTGAHDLKSLNIKKDELVHILNIHGLELAKWNSNDSSITSNIDAEIMFKISEDDVAKTLGMSWKPHQDIFIYRFELPDITNPTKRSVLSLVSKIYDLLGILSPIVIRCKIFLQEIWVQNIGWDDPLNDHLKTFWFQIKRDLSHIHQIQIPRFVGTFPETLGEIHGFADASQRAYGCCLYYRVVAQGKYKSTLLIAKSKVAPIKAQSLPRLELCAAVLLSRTWLKIKPKISKFVSSTYFWSDSKIVLQWLKLHSSTLNCFVANRVSELQDQSREVIWRHVPSKSNPADIVSRGCSASELPDTIWFSGPKFLQDNSSTWPENNEEFNIEILERRKVTILHCTPAQPTTIDEIIDKHSSYIKIIRIIAYIFRIFNRCPGDRALKPQEIVHIGPAELENVFWRIVSRIQHSTFTAEMQALSTGNSVQPSLQKLTPFLQQMKIGSCTVAIMRVGGRLSNAPIPYDARFPALLPKDHRFVKLYIEHLHRLHLHAGPKVLLGILRQKIWIVNARDVVRKVVRNCVHCFHYKPKLMQQIMGNLPADRLRAQRPFLVTGVDFCGPFLTSYRIRGKSPYKTYIAVFVCFASKATHLELVSDLSANNFILCLKRFVGRRGIPQRLYCDNATNFVGAHNKFRELKESLFRSDVITEMKSLSTQMGFEFCFIPPRAPHFGGLWEAAVKSTKTLLIKNIGQSYLTFEELQTLIIEIEAILNSRPIAPISDDPNDGEALTPGHLLIGSSLISVPDQHFDTTKPSALSRWQRISYLKQQFWEIWSRDYLLSLQQRSKWLNAQPNIEKGQLVIIHEDNIPPQQWLLARVTQTIPGPDGRIRVVELKSKNGICRRPIHKVAPVPSEKSA